MHWQFTLTSALFISTLVLGPTAQAQTTLTAELTSEQVGPYPADLDGEGSATFTVSVDERQLCYELQVEDIQPPIAAHIHLGEPGRVGPARLDLEPPVDGTSSGCMKVDADLLRALLETPTVFYVDVHNAEFPGAALRGQLSSF